MNASSVLGTCQVLHISEFEVKDHTWLDRHPDCFYIMSRATSFSSPLIPLHITDFRRCQICYQLEEEKYGLEMKCWEEKQLCAFDPFVGVGGFGLGLAQGCSMQTILGVDKDGSAAETMRYDIIIQLINISSKLLVDEIFHQKLLFSLLMPTNFYKILSMVMIAG